MIHEIGSIDKIYKIILVSGFSKDTYFIKGDIIDIINLIIDNKNIYQLDKIKNFENKNEYIEKNIEKIKEYNLNKKKKIKFNFLGGQYYKIDPDFVLKKKKKKKKKKFFLNCFK